MTRIHRAHEFACIVGADTEKDLVWALRQFALDIEMGQLTAGCSGSPSVGSVYAYAHDPAVTHDEYFRQINESLEATRARTTK